MGRVAITSTPLNSLNEFYLIKPGFYFVKLLNGKELIKVEKLIIK
jgi:hypothetical protein